MYCDIKLGWDASEHPLVGQLTGRWGVMHQEWAERVPRCQRRMGDRE